MTIAETTRPDRTGAARGKTRESRDVPPESTAWPDLLDRLVDIFSSLRLTIICLVFGLVLVFAGTIAQVELGLYKAQLEFFRSFLVFWSPKGAAWKIPVLPGGYLVGGILLLNLIAAH